MSRNDFSSVLHASLIRQMSHKATCQTCKQFATFDSKRSIPTRDLPPILALNSNVFNEENHEYWLDHRKQMFLTPTVELHGHVNDTDDPESVTYELRVRVTRIITLHY